MWELLRKLAFVIIKKTNYPNQLHLTFIHKECEQMVVQVTPRMFSWNGPKFVCLECNQIVPKSEIDFEIFDSVESDIPLEGSVLAYQLH